MSAHLPECLDVWDMTGGHCTCHAFRDCEKRVRRECITAIRARRDTFIEQIPARPVQTKSLSGAIYEDAIATLRGLDA